VTTVQRALRSPVRGAPFPASTPLQFCPRS
jgi:hypothetical protein